MVVVIFGEGNGKVKALVEFWNLWWFEWRWRRKKMKEKGWRSCSGGGDEEELVEVLVLVK